MVLTRPRFASMVFAGSLLLAACGGGGDGEEASGDASGTRVADSSVADSSVVDSSVVDSSVVDSTATGETTTTAAEQTTTVEQPTTTAEQTTATTAETTTIVEETTTTSTAATPARLDGPEGGLLFTDAGAQYSLVIAPTWTDGSSFFPDGIQGWFTGNETAAFTDNVNIVTEPIRSDTPVDLVVSASIETLGSSFTDFTLIESGVIPGTNHPELGFLEYTAVQDGVTIRFVQTFGLWNDTLVVFTGSTQAERGDAPLDSLRGYSLTIAPPAGA